MLDPDAPFVLRNNPRRFRLLVVIGVCLIGIQLISILVDGLATLRVLGVALGAVIVAVSVWSLRMDAVMTADDRGLSLRVFPGPDGVRTLDWDDVDTIYVHRISRSFRMLCVRPKHLDRERRWIGHERVKHLEKAIARTGAPYSANLTAAGFTDDQALDRLRALAAGRATIGRA